MSKLSALIFAAVLGSASLATAQPLDTRGQLVRCNDTYFGTGVYSTYFGANPACGGDLLVRGDIIILGVPAPVQVNAQGTSALNLYEVYWLPIGGDPTNSAVTIKIGNFLTDAAGNVSTQLRLINAPIDATGRPVEFTSTVGDKKDAGNFLIFSRGPYAFDTNGDGVIDDYNTSDHTVNGTVANPPTTLSNGMVQFISGYARP
ncbi:MAG: hypothetical protein IT369_10505 [Candidatus Latescibacteria bacterium]|nr:hypothetical protein [Candidatus Latescibacterota bacterium]